MKNLLSLLLFSILISCTQPSKELTIIDNADSEEITFIIELSTKENSKEDVAVFTQNISNFIAEREASTIVYGYYISEDGNNITLIERYKNSQDAVQHGKDFISGSNFNTFFEMFEVKSFITIGYASDEFKKFTAENGFVVDFRESVGGFVRR